MGFNWADNKHPSIRRANAVLTDLVKRVEKGELKADPWHITELRLN